MNLTANRTEIMRSLQLLVAPGEVTEMRVLKSRRGTISGYFNDLERAADQAVLVNDDPRVSAPAVYLTLNPVLPDLLARAVNQVKSFAQATTQDADIVHRRWLLLDFDPTRPSAISATDEEHTNALARAVACREWLSEKGWPEPVTADSGNGGHLLYRVDLPNDPASTDLVKRALTALASQFDDDLVKVDQNVFNPARICKLYGTAVRKGDSTPERPHRMAAIQWNGHATFEIVLPAQLEDIANLAPLDISPRPVSAVKPENIQELLAAWGLSVARTEDHQGQSESGTKFVLSECPFVVEHKDAAVFSYPTSVTFKCFHASCKGKNWKALRAKFEPWQQAIIKNENGAPRALLANAVIMLSSHPAWLDVLRFNEFSLCVVCQQPAPWQSAAGKTWDDDDDSRCAVWLQLQGVQVSSKVAGEAARTVARRNCFHPIREYLAGLIWDQQPRVMDWLTTYLGAPSSPLNKAIGQCWLISAVARVIQSGCKADHTLLLTGRQGLGKSTALQILAGPENFTDHLSDLGSKDSRIELAGRWIIEMSEFTTRRTELERKSFLTACADCYRPPYGRTTVWVPRQCVFAATTNDLVPLGDESGGRRYWPVSVGTVSKIDLARLRADRDQLWAEAFAAYQEGSPWWPDFAEFEEELDQEQRARYQPGVWDEAILDWCESPTQREEWANGTRFLIEPFDSNRLQVTIADVLTHCLGKSRDKHNNADQRAVRSCLLHAHWAQTKRTKIRGTKRAVNFFTRPQEKLFAKEE